MKDALVIAVMLAPVLGLILVVEWRGFKSERATTHGHDSRFAYERAQLEYARAGQAQARASYTANWTPALTAAEWEYLASRRALRDARVPPAWSGP